MLGIAVELGCEQFDVRSRCVAHVERDAHAASDLVARMEDAALDQAVIWDDLESFDGRAWRGRVDCITAGFPCQPWSSAGKQGGTSDERWLWPIIARIIRDAEPELVFLENVPGLVSGGGLHFVLDDLAESGFDAEWLHLRARDVGASHQRERVFLLACRGQWRLLGHSERPRPQGGRPAKPQRRDRPLAPGANRGVFAPGPGADWRSIPEHLQPAIEPGLCVLADGVALVVDESRADQLRCGGNGVVAIQGAAAFVELVRRLDGETQGVV